MMDVRAEVRHLDLDLDLWKRSRLRLRSVWTVVVKVNLLLRHY